MTTTSRPAAPGPITTPAAQAAGVHAAAVRRLPWAWPIAILVGFPIGGLVANLIVGKVDTAAAALAGGLIAGGIIGAAQWLALRPLVPGLWVVATSVGMAAGLTIGAALVDYGISRADLVVMGAITGLGVGGLQALLLGPRVSGAAVVGSPESSGLGSGVARNLVCDHKQRQGALHELRGRRSTPVRASDLAAPQVPVPAQRARGLAT